VHNNYTYIIINNNIISVEPADTYPDTTVVIPPMAKTPRRRVSKQNIMSGADKYFAVSTIYVVDLITNASRPW